MGRPGTVSAVAVIGSEKIGDRGPALTPRFLNNRAVQAVPYFALLSCCHALRNELHYKMIRSIRHKGLRRLYEDGDPRGVMAEHAAKLRDILARLDAAGAVADMDLPGFRLHPLKGGLTGFWAVTVRANWRVIFRVADGEVWDVDYVDYH